MRDRLLLARGSPLVLGLQVGCAMESEEGERTSRNRRHPMIVLDLRLREEHGATTSRKEKTMRTSIRMMIAAVW